jgi:hypothetical protein
MMEGDSLQDLVLVETAIESVKGSLDELNKIVEKATSGLKDTLKTQV